MSLIKVLTELDNGTITELPAKIVETKNNGDVFVIRYLSYAEKRDNHNRKIYKYEDDTYEITNESITEFLNSDFEIDLGYKNISSDEFVKYESDSDDDYTPSSDEDEEDSDSDSDEDSDEDESITDEDVPYEDDDDAY